MNPYYLLVPVLLPMVTGAAVLGLRPKERRKREILVMGGNSGCLGSDWGPGVKPSRTAAGAVPFWQQNEYIAGTGRSVRGICLSHCSAFGPLPHCIPLNI